MTSSGPLAGGAHGTHVVVVWNPTALPQLAPDHPPSQAQVASAG